MSLVCGQLKGKVIIGENCVIHPQVVIDAGHDSNTIILGDYVIIQERTQIRLPDHITSQKILIEDHVLIECDVEFYGNSIGAYSWIGCKGNLHPYNDWWINQDSDGRACMKFVLNPKFSIY
jgi:carbonic anhydrase/acetyltransferase-like protein (isoleucine patch superfamily)